MSTFYDKIKDFKETILNKNKLLAKSIVLEKTSKISKWFLLGNVLSITFAVKQFFHLISPGKIYFLDDYMISDELLISLLLVLCFVLFCCNFFYIFRFLFAQAIRKKLVELIDSAENNFSLIVIIIDNYRDVFNGLYFNKNGILKSKDINYWSLVKKFNRLKLEEIEILTKKFNKEEFNFFNFKLKEHFVQDGEMLDIEGLDDILHEIDRFNKAKENANESLRLIKKMKDDSVNIGSDIELISLKSNGGDDLSHLMGLECFMGGNNTTDAKKMIKLML